MRCVPVMFAVMMLFSAAAQAQQLQEKQAPVFIDELRLSLSAHDLDSGGQRREDGADIGGEVLFTQFTVDVDNSVLRILLTPRPHLGAVVNTHGDTSAAYAGLTWHVPLAGPLFVEGALGGAVHNGKRGNVNPGREPLGCRALFREAGAIGIDLNDRLRVMATISHMSNAGLCDENSGITDAGLALGYRF